LAVVVAALLAPVVDSLTRGAKGLGESGATSWSAPVVAALVAFCVALPLRAAPPAGPSVLILLAPSDAGSELLPPLESFAQPAPPQAEAQDEADVASDVAEAIVAEAPVEAAEPAQPQVEKSLSQQLEAGLEKSREETPAAAPERTVELPSDFTPPDQPVEIPDRPEWVDREPVKDGDDYLISVSSSMEFRLKDSQSSLDTQLVEATNEFIRDYLGSERATYFIQYSPGYIKRRLMEADKSFSDTVKTSVGPMQQSHAQLRIPPDFCAELDARWAKVVQATRVLSTAGGALAVLLALGLLFGYFRLDTATKGYYTGRLQMALVVAILALVAVGFVYYKSTAQWVYWLIM
jgi:hypothetical protein